MFVRKTILYIYYNNYETARVRCTATMHVNNVDETVIPLHKVVDLNGSNENIWTQYIREHCCTYTGARQSDYNIYYTPMHRYARSRLYMILKCA